MLQTDQIEVFYDRNPFGIKVEMPPTIKFEKWEK